MAGASRQRDRVGGDVVRRSYRLRAAGFLTLEKEIYMRLSRRTPLLAALLLSSVPALRAQNAVDPSGHWEGKMKVPGKEIAVEVDIARNTKGELGGTISMPDEHARGLPLAKVAVEG